MNILQRVSVCVWVAGGGAVGGRGRACSAYTCTAENPSPFKREVCLAFCQFCKRDGSRRYQRLAECEVVNLVVG